VSTTIQWDRSWSKRNAPWRRTLPTAGALRQRRAFLRIGDAGLDAAALVAAVALVGLGTANLAAVSGQAAALHQLVAAVFGLLVLCVAYAITASSRRPAFLAVLGWLTYGVAVLMMAAVLFVGVRAYGARRWIAVGSFTFQPSDLALLGLLFVLANVLGSDRPAWRRVGESLLLALVPILLAIAEPDLSTAALFAALTIGMFVLGRAPLRVLAPILALGVALLPLGVGLLQPYQLTRLRSFLSGGPAGGTYNWALLQGHIALASGGWFGIAHSPLHRLLAVYLPTSQTDLAFVSVVEELGLLAGIVVLLATALVVWRTAVAGRKAANPVAGLVASGLALVFGVEAAISLAGSLGFLPLAGVPYPLLSEGGTSAVIYLAALGITLGLRRAGNRRHLRLGNFTSRAPRGARAMAAAWLALFGALGGYVWHFQSADGAQYRQAGFAEMTRCVSLPAPRGLITDRHGVPVALDVPEPWVVAAPAMLARHPQTEARLASWIGVPLGQLRHRVATAPSTDLSLRLAQVSTQVARAVQAAHLPGVFVLENFTRRYPYGPLLAPLLGYVGLATPTTLERSPGLAPGTIVGRAGIEEYYDALLRGVDGQQCFYVNPAGVPVAEGPRRAPMAGANLVLTIDLGLQEQLTASLAAAVQHGGDLGAAVVMDPRTGQVLAMASVPAYNDNLFGPPVDAVALSQEERAPGLPMLEHATQVIGPPGSTFKLVVASADLADNVVNPAQVVPTGASYSIDGATFHNWADLGPMDLPTSIAWSNDVYFYKLAVALGPQRIDSVASELGVGQPTGIDLPGEDAGYLETPASVAKAGGTWYLGSTVILGIGQGSVAATPLQDARWTAAVATGAVVTPRLGLAYEEPGGHMVLLGAARPKPLPFASALGPLRQGMQEAVTSGIDTAIDNLPVPAEAKTGTAQDATAPGGTDAWYTAAAPASAPSVVVTAFVHGGSDGNAVAGPVVDQAMLYFFAHEAAITAGP